MKSFFQHYRFSLFLSIILISNFFNVSTAFTYFPLSAIAHEDESPSSRKEYGSVTGMSLLKTSFPGDYNVALKVSEQNDSEKYLLFTRSEIAKLLHGGEDKFHFNNKEAVLRDWKGIGRDTGTFLFFQPIITGMYYLIPSGDGNYTADQKKISWNKYVHNAKSPIFDLDAFWVNFIGHPYWGACFYIRARERGFSRLEGFAYSALLSTFFEYVTDV